MHKGGFIENLFVTVIASFILIIMGVLYFIISLWVVKFGSGLIGFYPDDNWAVLSASILVAGIMIGSAIKNA